MASAEYIAAAKKETRQPTCLLSIEDADAETTFYTTQADWAGSTTLTEIDTNEVVGSAIHAKYDITSFTVNTGDYQYTATYDHYVTKLFAYVFWSNALYGPTIQARAQLRDALSSPTETYNSGEVSITRTSFDGIFNYGTALFEFAVPTQILNTETWYFNGQLFSGGGWVDSLTMGDGAGGIGANAFIRVVKSTTAQVVTSTIDLGAVPSSNPTLNIDDIEPNGTSITYTAVGGNTDPPANSLGTVADGDSLTAYRYYRITANFTTTSGDRASIREISLTEGLFRYYGTHQDEPFSGIKPYIVQDSVGSLTSSIRLDKGASTAGEISLKLIQTEDTNDLVATNFLKGKDVQLSAGFVGLSTESYEPVITGSIQDVSISPNKREVDLKIRSVLKQFEKRKSPTVAYDANGDISSPATDLTYNGSNIITVIKDLYDKIGIRDRYVHEDYDTLETAATAASPKYDVFRTLARSKPIETWKLLDQLAQTYGLWLVPLGDGRIKPKVYDRNEAATITLDANEMKYGKLDLLYKEFYSRFLAYYNPNTTDSGTEPDNYDNAKFLFNTTAETLFFPEKGQKDWFDEWKVGRSASGTPLTAPPAALNDLVNRWDGWYADPLYEFKGTELPPRYASLDPGDIVKVINLPIPVPDSSGDWDSGTTYSTGERVAHEGGIYQSLQDSNLNNEPEPNPDYWAALGISYTDTITGRVGFTNGMRFLITSRTLNPNRATLDFTFLQVPYAQLGSFSEDEFSTAFDTTG